MNLEKTIYLSIQSEDSNREDVADIDGTDLSWAMVWTLVVRKVAKINSIWSSLNYDGFYNMPIYQ